MKRRSVRILCPNGHLGFGPMKVKSFYRGLEAKPDFIIADSGSSDVGPVPLATDTSASPLVWQRHDLEHMLLAARRLKIPMIVGSAGDTGTNSRVDLYVELIKDIALKHRLPRFKVGYFYSEVDKNLIRKRMEQGVVVKGLDKRPDLDLPQLEATERIVAVADIHPYIHLLDMGAEVIVGGRSSDSAIFAAPAIWLGFDYGLSYLMGKILECASFCAEPYGAKESVLGEIFPGEIRVTAMSPEQRCTVASVSGHAMYERPNPFYEYVLGGVLDMSRCHYEQFDERTTRITGAHFIPAEQLRVKLEGAGRVGERYLGIVGIRDPYIIANIDKAIAWAREQAHERFGGEGYELYFHVYGRDAILGESEPLRDRLPHEVCVVVEAVSPRKETAEELATIGVRQLFYARLPELKGTAGAAAFLVDEVLRTKPACQWTINHLLPVDEPMELFPTYLTDAGV